MIVDITSTGSTLEANNLKVLDDGLIFQSEAVLAIAKSALPDPRIRTMARKLKQQLIS